MKSLNISVLYVDDQNKSTSSNLKTFNKYFKNIDVAHSKKDALDIFYSKKIDLLLLDIVVKDTNGMSLVKEMRISSSDMEIIILSRETKSDLLMDALNANVFAYLIKPVLKSELSKTLDKITHKLELKFGFNLAGNYCFNLDTQNIFYQNKAIKISKSEKKLLSFLCQNSENHHSSTEIAKALFDVNTDLKEATNNVIQIISRFKKKMLKLHNNETFFIDNIYGVGYKIIK